VVGPKVASASNLLLPAYYKQAKRIYVIPSSCTLAEAATLLKKLPRPKPLSSSRLSFNVGISFLGEIEAALEIALTAG